MLDNFFYDQIQILLNSNDSVIKDSVLIEGGLIKAFGKKAIILANKLGIDSTQGKNKLLAPCLVDPHSFLEDPLTSRGEDLISLTKKATLAGYGQLALLPKGTTYRDRPELLKGLIEKKKDLLIHLWGGFSINGRGEELTKHADLIENDAIGLADNDSIIPIDLLRKGILVGEIGTHPILIAPRDQRIQGDGIIRECVETLRAGWVPDPIESETIPLSQVLELQKQYPEIAFRLMNISTSRGVKMIEQSAHKPLSSVCWWHIIKDISLLSTTDIGWTMTPSIGSPIDRKSLIKGLEDGILNAISVHSTPLNNNDINQPSNERLKGISGYNLVLPLLWQELVVKEGWSIEKLWDAISFGPSRMLNVKEEKISLNSRRWLIFDPDQKWVQRNSSQISKKAVNQPFDGKEISGLVIGCGLRV
tara:strand:- start:1239 stop:2495 length:1257 start_codon:yes stop_codon:yes gene_type:complete